MNWKAWAPLAVAAVLGLVAAKIALDMNAKNKQAENTNAKVARVVVAKAGVIPGAILKEDDLVVGTLASEQVPDGTFQKPADLVGRVVVTPLVKGQPILEALLAPQGAGSGLQALVPEGMRAITIEVNEFSGVAGLLLPGSHVDVLASMNDTQAQAIVSKTIVENVKVTAVGQRVAANQNVPNKDDANPSAAPPEPTKSVTLLVNPEQAEAIELATMTGRPRLVLRGNGDKSPANTFGVTVAELVGRSQPAMNRLASTSQPVAVQPVLHMRPATQPASEFEEHTIEVIRSATSSNTTVKVKKTPEQHEVLLQGVSTDTNEINH